MKKSRQVKKIFIHDPAFGKIMIAHYLAGRLEFSGFAPVNVEDGEFHIYDFVVADYGSETFSQFNSSMMAGYKYPDKIRGWVHKHPVPTWSHTDMSTIVEAPLGVPPQMMRWSANVVFTPIGPIGLIADYVGGVLYDAEVILPEYILDAMELRNECVAKLKREWADWDGDYGDDDEDDDGPY